MLGIPNNNVRKQYYSYLQVLFEEKAHLNTEALTDYYYDMAYLNLNAYYYTAPELELNHGYCVFFLIPDLTHYAAKHSYILELKVLSKKEWDEEAKDARHDDGTPMTKAEKQWKEAVEQIERYAIAPRVEALRQGTQLHRIVMQFKGWELARMEEV